LPAVYAAFLRFASYQHCSNCIELR
jgi:hypothetical protein